METFRDDVRDRLLKTCLDPTCLFVYFSRVARVKLGVFIFIV
jgi:hypothetical protein